jgi:hypothetical protein
MHPELLNLKNDILFVSFRVFCVMLWLKTLLEKRGLAVLQHREFSERCATS